MLLRRLFALVTLVALAAPGASLPTATRAEESGLSTERLRRIHDTMQQRIDSHDISGAVTLVIRKGRVVNFEAHGLADIEANKPMQKDAPSSASGRCRSR